MPWFCATANVRWQSETSGVTVTDRILVTVEDRVAEVRLNRPDKYNALDAAMFDGLAQAADRIASDPAVRAVVLYGEGKSFCAGIDLEVLQGGLGDVRSALMTPLAPSPANRFQRAAYAFRELGVPVICALHGVVFGGGFQVAMAADLRIAAPGTRLSIMESKWGLIPDMGLTTTLRGILPPDRVKELAWTAREVDAEEALALGIVTRIAEDPLTAARDLAAILKSRSPDAVRNIKRLVNDAWNLSDAESLALEARLQLDTLGKPNQLEAVRANLEKRAPDFVD